MDNYNILFSSVIGAPSFVHSPHVPNLVKNNSSSYLSILDPNLELPELSTTDIEEFLSDINSLKVVKEQPISNNISMKNKEKCSALARSLITSSKNIVEKSLDIPVALHTLKCVVKECRKMFNSKVTQIQHFMEEHQDKVVSCHTCKAKLISKYALYNHLLVKPQCKMKSTHRCTESDCEKYFYSKQKLEIHISECHSLPSISCLSETCSVKFFNIVSRNLHTSSHHRELIQSCCKCNTQCFDKEEYNRHMRNHMKVEDDFKNQIKYVYPIKCFVCPIIGCNKYFSNPSNLKRHEMKNHQANSSNNEQLENITQISKEVVESTIDSLQHSTNSEPVNEEIPDNRGDSFKSEPKYVYACPLPECVETLSTKSLFESHFLKHFTGELPGDINSLLPPDPPVPGLELHSKTFEANVDFICQREETNLLQALDLVPDKLLESLDFLDDEYLQNEMHSDLTSALILPSTRPSNNCGIIASVGNTNPNRRRKHPFCTHYSAESSSIRPNNLFTDSNIRVTDSNDQSDDFGDPIVKRKKECISTMDTTSSSVSNDKCLSSINVDKYESHISKAKEYNGVKSLGVYTSSTSNTIPSGLCARTCPRIAISLANLVRRRRHFLRDRVRMMDDTNLAWCQPAARQPALKQVVRQIFTSQQLLPSKYSEDNENS